MGRDERGGSGRAWWVRTSVVGRDERGGLGQVWWVGTSVVGQDKRGGLGRVWWVRTSVVGRDEHGGSGRAWWVGTSASDCSRTRQAAKIHIWEPRSPPKQSTSRRCDNPLCSSSLQDSFPSPALQKPSACCSPARAKPCFLSRNHHLGAGPGGASIPEDPWHISSQPLRQLQPSGGLRGCRVLSERRLRPECGTAGSLTFGIRGLQPVASLTPLLLYGPTWRGNAGASPVRERQNRRGFSQQLGSAFQGRLTFWDALVVVLPLSCPARGRSRFGLSWGGFGASTPLASPLRRGVEFLLRRSGALDNLASRPSCRGKAPRFRSKAGAAAVSKRVLSPRGQRRFF